MLYSTQCTQVIFGAAGSGASGSSTISTRLLAFGGTPVQASGGAISSASQVYLAGISPLWSKAAEVSLRVTTNTSCSYFRPELYRLGYTFRCHEAHGKAEVLDEKDPCPRLFCHFHSIRVRVCGSRWFRQLGRLVVRREQRSQPAGHVGDCRGNPDVPIHRRHDSDRRRLFEQLDCGKVLWRRQGRPCDLRLYLQGQLQRHIDGEWSDAGDQRLHLPALWN